jgi:DNA polymerase-3 subunit alpha
VDRHALNKRVLESLIKCGALDSLPGNRYQKLAILDAALDAGARAQKNRETGQIDMFGGIVADAANPVAAIPLPDIQEDAERRKEKLAWEKELLGVVFSSDPRKAALAGATVDHRVPLAAIRDAEGLSEYLGKNHTFAGMLTRVRALSTKKGDAMLVAALEDENEDVVELVAFPKVYEKYRDLLRQDALLVVQAKVDERNGAVQLVLESATHLDLSEAEPPPAAHEMDLEGLAEEGEPAAFDPAMHPATQEEPVVPGASPAAADTSVTATTPAAPSDAPAGGAQAQPMTTPISIIKPHAPSRPRATSATNGNGHDHAAPVTNGGTTHGRTMRLRFRRSADQEADIRLMQHVYDLLRGRDGADQVVIQLEAADRRVLLRMRQTVACDDGLVDALRGALGSECVSVE